MKKSIPVLPELMKIPRMSNVIIFAISLLFTFLELQKFLRFFFLVFSLIICDMFSSFFMS